MAKMYLESNNAGYDILITDENGRWWYANTDDGKYGDADLYDFDGCDTEAERVEKALANLRREINRGTYNAEDWIEDFGRDNEPVEVYDGKMGIDEIDNVVNYYSDGTPIGHDDFDWYEV